jgi:hypothetical protein
MAISLKKYDRQVGVSAQTGTQAIGGGLASQLIQAEGAEDQLTAQTFEMLGKVGAEIYQDFQNKNDEAELSTFNNQYTIAQAQLESDISKLDNEEEINNLVTNFYTNQQINFDTLKLSKNARTEASLNFNNALAKNQVLVNTRIINAQNEKQNAAWVTGQINAEDGIFDQGRFKTAQEANDYFVDKQREAGFVNEAEAVKLKRDFLLNAKKRADLKATTFDAHVNEYELAVRKSWGETKLEIDKASTPKERQAIYDKWKESLSTVANDNDEVIFLNEAEQQLANQKLSRLFVSADEFIETGVYQLEKQILIDSQEKVLTEFLGDNDAGLTMEDVENSWAALKEIDPTVYNEKYIRTQRSRVQSGMSLKTLRADVAENFGKAKQNYLEGKYKLDSNDSETARKLIAEKENNFNTFVNREREQVVEDIFRRIEGDQSSFTLDELKSLTQPQMYLGVEYQLLSPDSGQYKAIEAIITSTVSAETKGDAWEEFTQDKNDALQELIKNGFVSSRTLDDLYGRLGTTIKGKPKYSRETVLNELEWINDNLLTAKFEDKKAIQIWASGLEAIQEVFSDAYSGNPFLNNVEALKTLNENSQKWTKYIEGLMEKDPPEYPSETGQRKWFQENMPQALNISSVKRALARAAYIHTDTLKPTEEQIKGMEDAIISGSRRTVINPVMFGEDIDYGLRSDGTFGIL